jgi:hypothetical protein
VVIFRGDGSFLFSIFLINVLNAAGETFGFDGLGSFLESSKNGEIFAKSSKFNR